MIIAGIDYSKNSPGIVKFFIDDKDFSITKKEYLGITAVKAKNPKTPCGEHCIRFCDKDMDDYEKINIMSDNAVEFVKDCDYIGIEGFSYSSKGRVFDLAESAGVLKWRLYNQNKTLRVYAPTLIKMFASGNGNADKDVMLKYYRADGNKLNLPEQYISDHPYEDIIDAYYIAQSILFSKFGFLLKKSIKISFSSSDKFFNFFIK